MEFYKKDGGWSCNGVFFPRIAPIKIDDDATDGSAEKHYCGKMVHYAPGCIWIANFPGIEAPVCFADCKLLDTGHEIILPIYTLDLSSEQKEEIIKERNLSLNNFEKIKGIIIGPVFSKGSIKRLEEELSIPPVKGNYGSLVDDLGICEL